MTSEILIHGKFSLEKISAILNEKLSGQNITDHVQLESILLQGDKEWLHATMIVSGRHNGKIIAKFKLQTMVSNHDLKIDQLTISLEDVSALAKGVNWVFRHLFGEKIESKVQSILHKSISNMINEMTSKYSVVEKDGITVNTDLKDYNFAEVSWNDTHLMCTFFASGVIRVELE